jgi:hypothetical protein
MKVFLLTMAALVTGCCPSPITGSEVHVHAVHELAKMGAQLASRCQAGKEDAGACLLQVKAILDAIAEETGTEPGPSPSPQVNTAPSPSPGGSPVSPGASPASS